MGDRWEEAVNRFFGKWGRFAGLEPRLHGFSDRNLLSFSDFTRRRGVVSLRTGSNGQFALISGQTTSGLLKRSISPCGMPFTGPLWVPESR